MTKTEKDSLTALADRLAAEASHEGRADATVRSQVRAIHAKLGVCSQLEAVAAAHRTGWLQHRDA